MFKLFKSSISTKKTYGILYGLIFDLSKWNVLKIVSENARMQEAKKYQHFLRKDLQFPVYKFCLLQFPRHVVESVFLGSMHVRIRQ
jgi:hypothetical protein